MVLLRRKGRLIGGTVWLLALLLAWADGRAGAADVKEVPLWDGETRESPDGLLINRYGGPVVHQGGTKVTVSHETGVVHSGRGAYRADIAGPVPDFAFFQLSLSGFGPTPAYVMSRDLRRFDRLCFRLKNDTGVAFILKVELKDYRDSFDHRQVRHYPIPNDGAWQSLCASLKDGWTVTGSPDLQQARFIGFVFEALAGASLGGTVYFDDVVLVEDGPPMDPATTPSRAIVEHLVRRQFDGLWGSRSRVHGMIPLNSVYADVGALNATSAVVKLLPVAVEQGWITGDDADAYVGTLVATLDTLMDGATYLPPRYVDWLTLEANFVREESPVDAAFLALALYQYKSLPRTAPDLRTRIETLLGRFNFAAFGSPRGWKLAYRLDPPELIAGTYDVYSGEVWVISLAAHLMPNGHVEITEHYHSGSGRVRTYLVDAGSDHVVSSDARFRAPFLQWLFPLFVELAPLPGVFPVDTYPVPELATNPLENALRYQRDVHRHLALQGRALNLQPDAGDDGSGAHYEQFSAYDDFGQPALFMPWSVAFSMLAEPEFAETALRSHLAHGLHGPLGLSDSAHWTAGAPAPSRVTARHDFWNVSLSTMAMASWLFRDGGFLASLPEVRGALQRVYPRLSSPVCDLELSAPGYGEGDTLTVSRVRLGNPDVTSVPIRIEVVLGRAGSESISLADVGHDGSLSLPPRSDQSFGPYPFGVVSAETPRGVYRVDCRLSDPTTGHGLGEDLNPFEIR